MPTSDHVTITGRFVENGEGVPSVYAEAYDVNKDGSEHDLLGAVATHDDGTFEISVRRELAGTDDFELVFAVFYPDRRTVIGRTKPRRIPANRKKLDLKDIDLCELKEIKVLPARLHHGMTTMGTRGIESVPRSSVPQGFGRFGRMFPLLRGYTPEDHLLEALGKPGGPMDERSSSGGGDNPGVPAGLAFFGQFVDHDVTLDTTSSFDRQADPDGIGNFRTPHLELDNVYGAGPEAMPFLYDGPKMLVEKNCHGVLDVPRSSPGRALIGDPRNDENAVISQLQLGFLLFHNAVVDYLEAKGVGGEHLFEEAQGIVRWCYQWIVLKEFLPAVCKEEVLGGLYEWSGEATPVLRRGERRYYRPEDAQPGSRPYIPVEFSVAAYRFGHSMVRNGYSPRPGADVLPLFSRDPSQPTFGRGFEPITKERRIEWPAFFEIDGSTPQLSRLYDTRLPGVLFDLPFIEGGKLASLATRNLLRGRAFGLPSGQAVAKAMAAAPHVTPIEHEDIVSALGLGEVSAYCDTLEQTPLWYYLLAESELQEEGGKRLGGVGSRIVAEVLVGLLELDERSIFNANPCFTPKDELPAAFLRPDGETFDLGALLKVASDYADGGLEYELDGKPVKSKAALKETGFKKRDRKNGCLPLRFGS